MKWQQRLAVVAALGVLAISVAACEASGKQTQSHQSSARTSTTKHSSTGTSGGHDEKKAGASSGRAAVSSQSAEANRQATEANAALPQGKNHNQKAAAYAHPAAEVHAEMTSAYDASKPKIVYLTFDDGPNTVNTPKVLDILKTSGVPATFFVVGNQIGGESSAMLRRAYDEGHAIGLHSFSHTYGFETSGSGPGTQEEISGVLTAVRSVLGDGFATGAWRYPGGHMSWARTLAVPDKVVADNGMAWIDWNAASGDALGAGHEPTTVEAMLAYHEHSIQTYGAHNATVVLMHDAIGKDLTVAALPQLIDYYKQNGYQFGVIA